MRCLDDRQALPSYQAFVALQEREQIQPDQRLGAVQRAKAACKHQCSDFQERARAFNLQIVGRQGPPWPAPADMEPRLPRLENRAGDRFLIGSEKIAERMKAQCAGSSSRAEKGNETRTNVS